MSCHCTKQPTFPSITSVVAATASAVPSNAENALSLTMLATLSTDEKLEASSSGSLLDPFILKSQDNQERGVLHNKVFLAYGGGGMALIRGIPKDRPPSTKSQQ